jgi:hypothetical protein
VAFRDPYRKISSALKLDRQRIFQVLDQDDAELSVTLQNLVNSDEYKKAALNLEGDDAENFMSLVLEVSFGFKPRFYLAH